MAAARPHPGAQGEMFLASDVFVGLRRDLCALQAIKHAEICWLHEVNGKNQETVPAVFFQWCEE